MVAAIPPTAAVLKNSLRDGMVTPPDLLAHRSAVWRSHLHMRGATARSTQEQTILRPRRFVCQGNTNAPLEAHRARMTHSQNTHCNAKLIDVVRRYLVTSARELFSGPANRGGV